jgi:protein SCO1/2
MRGFILAVTMIVTLGGATIWSATDGLRAFTAEEARRLQALERPTPVPQPVVTDMRGYNTPLSAAPGEVLLVEFIFTTCPTICRDAGDSFARLQAGLEESGLGRKARMVSVSFDPRDIDTELLADYAENHQADGEHWTIARFADFSDRERTLAAYGVIVIPDPLFGYQHNAAIHVVDDKGKLVGIFDLNDHGGVFNSIRKVLS